MDNTKLKAKKPRIKKSYSNSNIFQKLMVDDVRSKILFTVLCLLIKEMLGMRYAKFLKDNEWEQASVIVSDEPGKFRQTKEGVPAPRVVSPYDIPGIYDIVFGTESK